MKLLLFLLLTVLLSSACKRNLSTDQKISYFYCNSRTINFQEDTATNYILYTDVYDIDTDERALQEKTRKWATLVDKSCKSVLGCTSDLNYYTSRQEAEAQRNEFLDRYKNPEKYHIEKLNFH